MEQANSDLVLQLTVVILIAFFSVSDGAAEVGVKGAYYPSYIAATYPSTSIDATLFTHLFFAFVVMDPITFEVKPPDSDTEQELASFTGIVTASNPAVRTLVSIRGGGVEATSLSQMAANPTSRKTFITTSIALARLHRFAGLDLDWESPKDATEMHNFGILISEWHAATLLEANHSNLPPLLLTAAVYYGATIPFNSSHSYPVSSIASNLDWINIMAYDYYGFWTPSATAEHTALYFNTDYGISTWLKAGLPPHKAVLGLAMYGRSWTLANASETWIGAPAVGPGPPQPISGEPGFFFFSEIMQFLTNSNVSTVYDNRTVCAYSFDSKTWVGYDNALSIANKVQYLMTRKMAGYFFWAVSFDSNWTLSNSAFSTMGSYSSSVASSEPEAPVS
ncbi:hypothetical protein O6H91_04G076000 [Diphasiastrum complanatum]|uniref:Uncharacterized protein n=1 Tax=Diphasiastrum complanatum TaxID=34168 RepID=A0ACC2DY73_DIPCM|nr:hypothetical protein O6H91_04G076000 [Diphasiastrum complanatum]